jgi:uncharacterized protein YndB with AHSA1/START domain
MSTQTRQLETTLEVKAPVEAVWRALTDAQELQRWFPVRARSTPGKGGSIWISWGAPWEGECTIEIWEPNRHLRTLWPWQGDSKPVVDGQPVQVAVDYFLEGRGGVTTLRLVHSGFGRDAGWDDEFDSVRRGWRFELQSLKHYLEHHASEDRAIVWVVRKIKGSRREAWPVLTGPGGLGGHGTLAALRAGDAFALGPKDAEAVRGRVLGVDPPQQFFGAAENFNNGIMRIEIEGPCFDRDDAGQQVWLWLSTYGVDRGRLDRLQGSWRAMLERLFPDGEWRT